MSFTVCFAGPKLIYIISSGAISFNTNCNISNLLCLIPFECDKDLRFSVTS